MPNEQKYFQEVERIIVKNEADKIFTELRSNYKDLMAKWNIGKILVEAQGGEKRAKYGNELIKRWSKRFTLKYGNGYDYTNLSRFRQFYLYYPIVGTVCQQLSWSHYRYVLTLKNEDERNYYINQVVLNNLSVRELRNEIKSKAFDRLSYADKNNIKLIDENNKSNLPMTIKDIIKDPIILETDMDLSNIKEENIHDILIKLANIRYLNLGAGYALIGHEYRIVKNGTIHYIDLLYFNYLINCFVVIEVKRHPATAQDIGQIELYVKLVDDTLKRDNHNKTVGIILVPTKNEFMVDYCTSKENIFLTTFKIINKNENIMEQIFM